MVFEIENSVLEKAANCQERFSCLSGVRRNCCKVLGAVNGVVHFIDCQGDDTACSYRTSFSNWYICECPVRKELFTRYRT